MHRPPFFLPDGGWLAFFVDDKLKKIAIQGVPVIELADGSSDNTGLLDRRGRHYFTHASTGGIWRVAADGSAAAAVTELEDGEIWQGSPASVPGSDGIVFTVMEQSQRRRITW